MPRSKQPRLTVDVGTLAYVPNVNVTLIYKMEPARIVLTFQFQYQWHESVQPHHAASTTVRQHINCMHRRAVEPTGFRSNVSLKTVSLFEMTFAVLACKEQVTIANLFFAIDTIESD